MTSQTLHPDQAAQPISYNSYQDSLETSTQRCSLHCHPFPKPVLNPHPLASYSNNHATAIPVPESPYLVRLPLLVSLSRVFPNALSPRRKPGDLLLKQVYLTEDSCLFAAGGQEDCSRIGSMPRSCCCGRLAVRKTDKEEVPVSRVLWRLFLSEHLLNGIDMLEPKGMSAIWKDREYSSNCSRTEI